MASKPISPKIPPSIWLPVSPDCQILKLIDGPAFQRQNAILCWSQLFWLRSIDSETSSPTDNSTGDTANIVVMKTNNEEITDVVFRIDKEKIVFALFPALPGTNDPTTCTCYEHVGQHSSADPWLCILASKPATPEQSRPLYNELIGRGYQLRVISRIGRHYYEMRRKELFSGDNGPEVRRNAPAEMVPA